MTQFKLKTYDRQEAFDLVVRHLASMPHPAFRSTGTGCVYVTPDGLRCAAGALFKCSDAELKPFADAGSFIGLVNDEADRLVVGPDGDQLDENFELFVQSLQELHDASGPASSLSDGNQIRIRDADGNLKEFNHIWADSGHGRYQGWDALRAFARANHLSGAIVDEVAP